MHSNKCEIDSQASAWGALDIIDNLIERDNEQKSSQYHQRKKLIDGIPTACLEIIQGVRVGKRIQKTKETFIHQSLQTNDFVPCFLESEMHLWASELFLDGTFSLTRSTEFSQVYIFSHLFLNDHKTFSYPLIFIMMRNKKKISYDDIFNFLKTQYFNKFEIELKPFMFHLDCEQATISSLLHNFPETPVTLCSVHIIRNLMKQLKTYTTGDFYKNPVLLKFWRILTGSLFLNLNCPEILSEILRYFKFDILTDENLENPLKNQLEKYIDQYLIKYYFGANSQFNFTLFNYYENTNVGNYNFSTNSLESLNRRLKEACGAGQLPLKNRLFDYENL